MPGQQRFERSHPEQQHQPGDEVAVRKDRALDPARCAGGEQDGAGIVGFCRSLFGRMLSKHVPVAQRIAGDKERAVITTDSVKNPRFTNSCIFTNQIVPILI